MMPQELAGRPAAEHQLTRLGRCEVNSDYPERLASKSGKCFTLIRDFTNVPGKWD
jgi:hypothetical protein